MGTCPATAPGDEVDSMGRTEWWHSCDRSAGHRGRHRCKHGDWQEEQA